MFCRTWDIADKEIKKNKSRVNTIINKKKLDTNNGGAWVGVLFLQDIEKHTIIYKYGKVEVD